MGWLDYFFKETKQKPKALKESWGDMYMPQQYIADVLNRANSGYLGVGIWANNNPKDRAFGADYPFVRNEADLAMMRNASRYCVRTISNASGTLTTLTSYVISTGFNATCRSDTENELAGQCEAVIARWIVEQNFESLQEEIFQRSRVDGEIFLRFFPQADGDIEIRFIEPECVTQPLGSDDTEWLFGIKTDPMDSQNIKSYNVRYLAGDEEVKPDQIIHYKVNCTGAMKRGVPDFSFNTLEGFNLAAKLTRNIGEGAAVQAAIAAVREHESSSLSQVDDFLDTQTGAIPTAPYSYPGMQPQAFSGYQQFQPGSFLDIPTGIKYVSPPGATNVEKHLEVLQAVLRSAGMRWSAPEWVVSSRSDSMSYASSLTAEAPFLRTCARFQRDYRRVFRTILHKVLDTAALVGTIPIDWEKTVQIDVSSPAMEIRDKGAEARANQVYYDMGVKSKHTICSDIGLSFNQEQEFIATEYKTSESPPEQGYALDMEQPGSNRQGSNAPLPVKKQQNKDAEKFALDNALDGDNSKTIKRKTK